MYTFIIIVIYSARVESGSGLPPTTHQDSNWMFNEFADGKLWKLMGRCQELKQSIWNRPFNLLALIQAISGFGFDDFSKYKTFPLYLWLLNGNQVTKKSMRTNKYRERERKTDKSFVLKIHNRIYWILTECRTDRVKTMIWHFQALRITNVRTCSL